MKKAINFDMDGTLANFYGVEGWLDDLMNESVRPYLIAKPLLDMVALSAVLRKLSAKGYEINIISWTSRGGSDDFNARVEKVKREWLTRHLHNVKFNNIMVVPYGTPKHTLADGILFDDEIGNRTAWGEGAYDVNNILEVLKTL